MDVNTHFHYAVKFLDIAKDKLYAEDFYTSLFLLCEVFEDVRNLIEHVAQRQIPNITSSTTLYEEHQDEAYCWSIYFKKEST